MSSMYRYCFLGDSFAAEHLREAAQWHGLSIRSSPERADLIFVSEDTPTDAKGNRDLSSIEKLVHNAQSFHKDIVVTSQVPPGWCREHGVKYHQAETLRIKDATQRARHPEQIIVGMQHSKRWLSDAYRYYLYEFECPIHFVALEEAEFAKLAINYFLAKQVETTNDLAERAKLVGAEWKNIAFILGKDSRIGKYAYLSPGDWKKSIHLLRDYVTLNEIKAFE